MTISHDWAIVSLHAHALNANCVCKIEASLTSSLGDESISTNHDFWVSPTGEPADLDDDPSTFDWVDKKEGFTSTDQLTPTILWSWIDERYDRLSLEFEHEKQLQPEAVAVPVALPW